MSQICQYGMFTFVLKNAMPINNNLFINKQTNGKNVGSELTIKLFAMLFKGLFQCRICHYI